MGSERGRLGAREVVFLCADVSDVRNPPPFFLTSLLPSFLPHIPYTVPPLPLSLQDNPTPTQKKNLKNKNKNKNKNKTKKQLTPSVRIRATMFVL